MKRLLIILLILAFNQNISTMDWNLIPLDTKKEIAFKLINEAIYKIKSAKTLEDLSDAMKDLKNFSLASKENNRIFKELIDFKFPNLPKYSSKLEGGKFVEQPTGEYYSLIDIFEEQRKHIDIMKLLRTTGELGKIGLGPPSTIPRLPQRQPIRR